MEETITLGEAHVKGFDLVREHSSRFASYVRCLSDEEVAQPVPDTDWSVGEVVTHVQSVYERYTADTRRSRTPFDLGEQNGEDVDRIGVDVGRSARSIEEQVDTLASAVAHVDPEQTFPFHAGVATTLAGGWGNLLGELLAHGDDIARATGKDFGVPGEDLEILWRFTSPLLAGWLRRDASVVDESWDLEFSFGVIRLTIADGSLRVGDRVRRDDHRRIAIADAAEWTLAFPYRRRAFTDPDAALLASRLHVL
jgi:uncharacterized protein (TIGR03083 family)